ncbi:MAG: hypothetical protein IPF92_12970, partial [Myxococcales bacterium]|nr:hypothetical protein [Myxococcales bacterium]
MSPPEKDASLDPVAIGAEMGAALWRDRSFDADRGTGARLDALAWVRASRASRCAAATDEQRVEPAALLSAVVPSDGSGQPIAGVLDAAARDLRLALSWLSGAKITKRGVHGYEPKDDDVFAMLLDAERRVSVAVRAVRLEHDASLLAIHAAACGAVPEALRAPGDCREDVRESAIERAARARGA